MSRLEHLVSADCPCRPEVIPVKRDDGSIGYVYVHRQVSR